MSSKVLEIKVGSLDELNSAANTLLNFMDQDKIVLFKAEMGSGKTTFIKFICAALGSSDNFSSPTYALVNNYTSPKGNIYHFDLYRLKSIAELFDIGIEDYLDGKSYCFFEWPEKLIDIIDINYVLVEIKIDQNFRYIRASKVTI